MSVRALPCAPGRPAGRGREGRGQPRAGHRGVAASGPVLPASILWHGGDPAREDRGGLAPGAGSLESRVSRGPKRKGRCLGGRRPGTDNTLNVTAAGDGLGGGLL